MKKYLLFLRRLNRRFPSLELFYEVNLKDKESTLLRFFLHFIRAFIDAWPKTTRLYLELVRLLQIQSHQMSFWLCKVLEISLWLQWFPTIPHLKKSVLSCSCSIVTLLPFSLGKNRPILKQMTLFKVLITRWPENSWIIFLSGSSLMHSGLCSMFVFSVALSLLFIQLFNPISISVGKWKSTTLASWCPCSLSGH